MPEVCAAVKYYPSDTGSIDWHAYKGGGLLYGSQLIKDLECHRTNYTDFITIHLIKEIMTN